jgi:hypothetical protein
VSASTAADPRAELAGRIMGFMVSQAVYVAAKLGVADLVAEKPRSADELAEAARADPDALFRVLRFLAGYGIFVEGEEGFANSELSELLRDVPGSQRDFALVFGEEFYPAFGETLRLVETGEPSFDAVFGAAWDDYLGAHPEKSARFNRFMAHGKTMLADVSPAWNGAVGRPSSTWEAGTARCSRHCSSDGPICAGSCSTFPTSLLRLSIKLPAQASPIAAGSSGVATSTASRRETCMSSRASSTAGMTIVEPSSSG